MGYSTEFLRGILALISLVAVAGLLLGAANEVLGLGLFAAGYPAGPDGTGFGGFALRLGVVLAISVGLSYLVERWNG